MEDFFKVRYYNKIWSESYVFFFFKIEIGICGKRGGKEVYDILIFGMFLGKLVLRKNI